MLLSSRSTRPETLRSILILLADYVSMTDALVVLSDQLAERQHSSNRGARRAVGTRLQQLLSAHGCSSSETSPELML
jgi:hypothetical protein